MNDRAGQGNSLFSSIVLVYGSLYKQVFQTLPADTWQATQQGVRHACTGLYSLQERQHIHKLTQHTRQNKLTQTQAQHMYMLSGAHPMGCGRHGVYTYPRFKPSSLGFYAAIPLLTLARLPIREVYLPYPPHPFGKNLGGTDTGRGGAFSARDKILGGGLIHTVTHRIELVTLEK